MNNAQAKDNVLAKIRQEGMVDMYADNDTNDDNEWFFRYRAELLASGLIEINKGGTHNQPYYKVRLTGKGLTFLDKGGYAGNDLV